MFEKDKSNIILGLDVTQVVENLVVTKAKKYDLLNFDALKSSFDDKTIESNVLEKKDVIFDSYDNFVLKKEEGLEF